MLKIKEFFAIRGNNGKYFYNISIKENEDYEGKFCNDISSVMVSNGVFKTKEDAQYYNNKFLKGCRVVKITINEEEINDN